MRAAGRVAAALAILLATATSASAQGETVEYYGLDALGSVRVVFDANGTIIGRMDYGPFGQELFGATGMPDRRYAGLFRDGEAGLDAAGARSYQSRTGRFSSVDPIYAGLFQPQRWNRYAYALNSPLGFLDPAGLQAVPNCMQKADGRIDCGTTTVTVTASKPQVNTPNQTLSPFAVRNPVVGGDHLTISRGPNRQWMGSSGPRISAPAEPTPSTATISGAEPTNPGGRSHQSNRGHCRTNDETTHAGVDVCNVLRGVRSRWSRLDNDSSHVHGAHQHPGDPYVDSRC